MVARERLPVGQGHVRAPAGGGHFEMLKGRARTTARGTRRRARTRRGRPPRDAEVGARERLPVDVDTCAYAAKGGHLDCSGRERLPVDVDTCAFAAGAAPRGAEVGARERLPVGHVDVRARGGGGHLEVLKWARENGCPWDQDDVRARGGGRPPRGAVARAPGLPVGRGGVRVRGEGGHLEVLKWARENDCPWDEETCADAAEGGHLEVLQWARENGCPWGALTCFAAAESGHLDVLEVVRENGCPWDEETCAYAAKGGHLRGAEVGARERLPVG